MPRLQKPGRKGTGMPSDPDVKAFNRLAAISSTCESAMVAITKYGPRSRLERKPITRPVTIATAAPISNPIHGEMPQVVPESAAA